MLYQGINLCYSGSSLFKDKIDYQNLPRISRGRTPPNLEECFFEARLGNWHKGFHDKILGKLKDINIQTISYELRDWNSLENTINLISTKLDLIIEEI